MRIHLCHLRKCRKFLQQPAVPVERAVAGWGRSSAMSHESAEPHHAIKRIVQTIRLKAEHAGRASSLPCAIRAVLRDGCRRTFPVILLMLV